MSKNNLARSFGEIVVFLDDKTWLYSFVTHCLKATGKPHSVLPSTFHLRHDWEKIKDTKQFIFFWENTHRSAGAMIEELLELNPNFDVKNQVTVLTCNPTRGDVVYFSELGIRNIFRLRNRVNDLTQSKIELIEFLKSGNAVSQPQLIWDSILLELDRAIKKNDNIAIDKLSRNLEIFVKKFPQEKKTARYFEAKACVEMIQENYEIAEDYWKQSLECNPNYYRTYKNMTLYYIRTQKLDKALALLEKLQSSNRDNISRLILMGELKMRQRDYNKAEHLFKSALERDSYCSKALNGLAEIKFLQGDLDSARDLLSRSYLAVETATKFNNMGIALVHKNKYVQALELYKKAQYVLPQHEKGPMLFFNIALCYLKWGKKHAAKEFLTLALVKQPDYPKAEKLLSKLNSEPSLAA